MPEIEIPELVEYRQLELPEMFSQYYDDFLQMSYRRDFNPCVMSSGGNTITVERPMPLSFKDIEAWAFCYNITLSPVQTRVITLLDNIWLRKYAEINR